MTKTYKKKELNIAITLHRFSRITQKETKTAQLSKISCHIE